MGKDDIRQEITFAKKPRLRELLRLVLDEKESLENALRTCQSMRIESRMFPSSKLKSCVNCHNGYPSLSRAGRCHDCSYSLGRRDALEDGRQAKEHLARQDPTA